MSRPHRLSPDSVLSFATVQQEVIDKRIFE